MLVAPESNAKNSNHTPESLFHQDEAAGQCTGILGVLKPPLLFTENNTLLKETKV
jgi:hypothetical protein